MSRPALSCHFALLIDFDVLDFALKLSNADRRRLFNHFLAIKSFPGSCSDFVGSGQNRQIFARFPL